jgi:hypothetical protein
VRRKSGILGGADYARRHGSELHAAAAESDFGADRIWRVDFSLPAQAKSVADRVEAALVPLGIARGPLPARGGPDLGPLVALGVPALTLSRTAPTISISTTRPTTRSTRSTVPSSGRMWQRTRR